MRATAQHGVISVEKKDLQLVCTPSNCNQKLACWLTEEDVVRARREWTNALGVQAVQLEMLLKFCQGDRLSPRLLFVCSEAVIHLAAVPGNCRS